MRSLLGLPKSSQPSDSTSSKTRLNPLGFKSLHLVLVIGILVALIVFMSVWGNSASKSVNWVGYRLVPNDVLQKVVQENYLPPSPNESLDVKQIKVLPVKGEKDNLYVIDFNTQQLCGQAGCLYVGYTQSRSAAFRFLLEPKLPQGFSLFGLSDSYRNGYPCLIITQVPKESATVESSTYCYEGNSFIWVNSSVTVFKKNKK